MEGLADAFYVPTCMYITHTAAVSRGGGRGGEGGGDKAVRQGKWKGWLMHFMFLHVFILPIRLLYPVEGGGIQSLLSSCVIWICATVQVGMVLCP